MQFENQELLRKLHQRDMLYRVMQFMVIIAIISSFVITNVIQSNANNQILQGIKAQNVQLQQAVSELKKDNGQRLDQQGKYIQCIAKFFAQPNHSTLVISDLDKCLATNAQAASSSLPTGSTSSPQGSQLASSSGSPKSVPSPSPASTQQTAQPSPSPTPQPQPVSILGIPICAQVTGICLTR